MSGTSILWGQITAAIVILLLALWSATQYVAYALGYQAQLGAPITQLFGFPIYWPWKYFEWVYFYDPYAPEIFTRAMYFVYFGAFFLFGVLVVLSIRRARKNKAPDTYGSASWGDVTDLEKAGLLADDGIVLGGTKDKQKNLIRHDGPEHAFVFAPPRSGKGVGIVIPTLLSWRHSAIIYDMRRENWDSTAGWRSKFSHALKFDPTSPDSICINPLLAIRKGLNEVRDVQNIADILVDPEGTLDRRDHWDKTSHSLLVGAILHVLYAEPDKSLTGVLNFLSDPARPFIKTLKYMLSCRHVDGRPHPVVASVARELLDKTGPELSGVLSTAKSFLGLYRDPIVSNNTSRSDFAIEDLMHADHPVSLYLVVPPSDASRTRPLIRLILNQIGRRLTESMGRQGVDYNHRLLMLLDEFPALGRLQFFEDSMAFLSGYGIRVLLIAQSLNQVEKAYGANNAILDNCHIRETYGTLDDRTAKRVSDMLGTSTETRRQVNYAGHRLALWLGHTMVSEQESPRPLLTPGEILQFPPDEALIMVGGVAPYRALKLRYYEDSRFKARSEISAPGSRQAQAKELIGLNTEKSAWLGIEPVVVEAGDWDSDDADQVSHAELFEEGGMPLDDEAYMRELELSDEIDQSPDDDLVPLHAHEVDDAEKNKEIERQIKELNRQQSRQRTIEQSRDSSGGGMPL